MSEENFDRAVALFGNRPVSLWRVAREFGIPLAVADVQLLIDHIKVDGRLDVMLPPSGLSILLVGWVFKWQDPEARPLVSAA
jgi:hypothetical protein